MGLYNPDMASAPPFSSSSFLAFLKDYWKKNQPLKKTQQKKSWKKEGLVGAVLAEEKGETHHHQ